MQPTAGPDRAAVEALARDVVALVSPGELPLFRATAEAYFADPGRAPAVRGRTDEELGFGVETAVALVGPFALDLVRKVLTSLTEKVGDALAEAVAARLARRVGPATPPTAPGTPDDGGTPGRPEAFDPAQLALVRQVAREEAGRLAVPPEQASRLADAVVATIATRG